MKSEERLALLRILIVKLMVTLITQKINTCKSWNYRDLKTITEKERKKMGVGGLIDKNKVYLFGKMKKISYFGFK